MKAINLYHNIIEENIQTVLDHGLNKHQNILFNIINLLIRKFSNQKNRLISLRLKYIKKIPYFSAQFSLDYLEYIIKNNPDIPYDYYPKNDKNEIDFFLKIMLKGVYSDGYYLEDFGDRWDEFEAIRKNVGRNLKLNLFSNVYELYGFKSVVYPDTGIFPDNYKLKILKSRKHDVCFDIGAYIGDSAYIINNELNPRKIYAFEPEKNNFNILSENIKLNNLNNVIVPVNVATSSEEGSMVLESMNASSSLKLRKKLGGQTVKVTTLDSFVKIQKLNSVDLIKMDIEGAEMNTLLGAKELIKKYKPDLVIALYHKGQHFFEIPVMLRKLVPDYKFRFIALKGSSPVIERFLMASIRKI